MKTNDTEIPALILIDIQKGFDQPEYWGDHRNNPDAEEKARELLDCWRSVKFPVFHIRHCSTNPNSPLHSSNPGNEFKAIVRPVINEPIISKNVNSAFIGTDLKDRLDNLNIRKLVIAGLTTDHCVSTTVRMAGNYGFDVFLASDATATFSRKGLNGETFPAELIHQTALASLNSEFATVVPTEFLVSRIVNQSGGNSTFFPI